MAPARHRAEHTATSAGRAVGLKRIPRRRWPLRPAVARALLGSQYALMLEYRAEIALWALSGLLPFIMLGDDQKFPLTVGLYTLLAAGANQPSLYNLIITGAMISLIPLIALFLTMQRHWRTDMSTGAVKS